MIKLVMATHGNFAKCVHNTINMIYGEYEALESVSCFVEKDFDIQKTATDILEKYKNDELIIVTDIFGGSVNNAFLSLLPKYQNAHLITGLNLPLMIELLIERESYSDVRILINNTIQESKNFIKYCN